MFAGSAAAALWTTELQIGAGSRGSTSCTTRCSARLYPIGVNITSTFLYYCTFSFKSTGGVTRDTFYLFNISAAGEFLRSTSKFSTFKP
jgi:hypothetical protein